MNLKMQSAGDTLQKVVLYYRMRLHTESRQLPALTSEIHHHDTFDRRNAIPLRASCLFSLKKHSVTDHLSLSLVFGCLLEQGSCSARIWHPVKELLILLPVNFSTKIFPHTRGKYLQYLHHQWLCFMGHAVRFCCFRKFSV